MYLANAGEYERALELDITSRNIQGYDAPFIRANVAIRQNDWQAARAAVIEALERDPDQPWMPGFWGPETRTLRIDPMEVPAA